MLRKNVLNFLFLFLIRSEIARSAIKERLVILDGLDKILVKSKFTERDALELGRKVNKIVAKKYLGE